MRALRHTIGRFGTDRRGNIAVIFALALLPVMTALGCAADYSMVVRTKAKLQSAADAASIAAIAQKSPGYVAALKMTSDGSVADAVDDANKVLDGNLDNVGGYTNLSRTSTVTKAGIKLTSRIDFGADVPANFLRVLGYQNIRVTGSASSTASLPPYLDFYLMLDVSGSMGLPSTNAEQTRLAAINPDMFEQYPGGCTLACHFTVAYSCMDGSQRYATNNACLGYWISRVSPTAYATLVNQKSTSSVPKLKPGLPNSMLPGLPNSLISGNTSSLAAVSSCPTDGAANCIQLRADAVGYAVNQLFTTANAAEKVTDQFRIGLYPFIRYLYAYFPLTSNINGSSTNSSTINYAAANLASLLDTNAHSSLGSGGTHLDGAFSDMNAIITSVGDGGASNRTQPYVFLVTDGAQDPQVKAINGGGWSGSNHATVIDPAIVCKPLKDRGIIISVLYIPYEPIQNPNASFANNEDGYANDNIDDIPPSLKACASPGFFYTANTPADIATALNAMFKQSLVTAHITN